MRERNAAFHSKQHRQQISRRAQRVDAVGFFNLLTGPELLGVTESHLPEHRERLYPPTVTLSMFTRQALDADGSCQKAVNSWAAQCRAEGLSVQSVRTGGYCKARERLPISMVAGLTHAVGELVSARAKAGWRWRGRHVKLVDRTGISMPDTPENQECYPQPSSQAEGVRLSAGACRRGDLSGDRRRDRCGDRATCGQRQQRVGTAAHARRSLFPWRCDTGRCVLLQLFSRGNHACGGCGRVV